MPTLIFLALAYQVENKKLRYGFLILAVANLIFNIYSNAWVPELYSAVIALLLYNLNPCFLFWWQRKNMRNNPSSFWMFAKETYQIAKYNKLKLFFWMGAFAVSMTAVDLYTHNTGYTLLGWIVAICIIVYTFKNLFYSMLPPEWFLHDVNTGYVFLTVFTAWAVSQIMYQKLSAHFIIPVLLAAFFCLVGVYLARGNTRFLVPGCAVVVSDLAWQVIRYFQSDMSFSPQFIMTEVILIGAILIGLRWLIKQPSILPIVYLSLFQLFRFSAFAYQAVDRLQAETLTTDDVTYYILYLVCWMYIIPLIFWFVGVIQRDKENLY